MKILKVVKFFWGDLQGNELLKYVLLSLGFFFLIGAFWPLKTLKESIFINIVGPLYLPYAKLISLALLFPVVLFYSKLVDMLEKEKLIYAVIGIYVVLGFILVYFLCDPVIGLENTTVSPSRWIGWIYYLFVESFITLMISLYWSFINDITTPESAKKGYGLIAFGTQLGGVLFILLGNYLSNDPSKYAKSVPIITAISVATFLMLAVIVYILKHFVIKDKPQGYEEIIKIEGSQEPKEKVSFHEGLKILLTRPYVAGIFAMIFFQEFITTVIGFQLSLMVKASYVDPGAVNKFLFNYALAVQVIACAFALFGTSYFQRKYGIPFCLIVYPLLIGAALVAYLLHPSLHTVTYLMLIGKSLNYAFNQPAKESLYIPTIRSIKYKSKAWIDMFGMRFAKASGSTVNALVGSYISCVGFFALSCIGAWIFIAGLIGKKFTKVIENKQLID